MDEEVERLIKEMRRGDQSIKRNAAKMLARIGDISVIPYLLEDRYGPTNSYFDAIDEILENEKDFSPIIPKLVEKLVFSGGSEKERIVLSVMKLHKDGRDVSPIISALIEKLKKDGDGLGYNVWWRGTIEALECFRKEEIDITGAVPNLIKILRIGSFSSKDMEDAVVLLGKIEDSSAVPVLFERLSARGYQIRIALACAKGLERLLESPIPEIIAIIKGQGQYTPEGQYTKEYVIKKIMERGYLAILQDIKDFTLKVMEVYKGKKSQYGKKAIIRDINYLTTLIHDKMNLPNRLDDKEPLSWSKTRKKSLGPKQPIRAHPKDNQMIPRG